MKVIAILFALLFSYAIADCPVYIPNEHDIIIMDAEQRGPGGGWEFGEALPGWDGSGYLAYKPDSSIGWAEQPPTSMADERIKTYRFKVNTAGTYRMVLKSSAPHPTEHNDVFMAFPESGALMRRHGETKDLTWPMDKNADWDTSIDSSNFFKVYQNQGNREWNYGGKTVDFNGHDIITRELQADGTWYSLRLCGRSTQYFVDRIYLFRCEIDEGECDFGSEKYWKAISTKGEQSMCEGADPRPLPVAADTMIV